MGQRMMRGIHCFCRVAGWGICLWWAVLFPAHAEEMQMRIAIVQKTPQVTFGSSVTGQIADSNGQVVGAIEPMKPRSASISEGRIHLAGVRSERLFIRPSTADGLVYIDDRWYQGSLELRPDGGGLTAINHVPLENYIASVVGSEMGDRFADEALKAQAVAARTYALYHRNRRLSQIFDLGDSVTWQVYKGLESATPRSQAAAHLTRGQILAHDNRPIDAVFHSSSGGHTENSEDVWSESRPYLRAVNDSHVSPPMPWQERIDPDRLERLFGDVGNVLALEVSEATPSGRAVQMRLRGTHSSREFSAISFRQRLDLRSTFFEVDAIGPAVASSTVSQGNLSPTVFILTGQGYGHGIGMSQWGAHGFATQGWNYRKILDFYYQNTVLGAIALQ